MPSLHVAWALWCAATLIRSARRPAVRLLGLFYPTLTTLVVLGTACRSSPCWPKSTLTMLGSARPLLCAAACVHPAEATGDGPGWTP